MSSGRAGEAPRAPAPGDVVVLRPRGPYRLVASARWPRGGTRRVGDGVVVLALRPGGAPADALVRQRPDGAVEAVVRGAAAPEEALAQLRWMLGVDEDLTPFLDAVAGDPLLGPLARARPWLRPVRLATVAESLLMAMAGQLVTDDQATRTHRRIVARAAPAIGDLRLPPTAAELRALSVAEMRAAGLATRRAATLARLVRTGDPERLRAAGPDALRAWAARERGIGPWTLGVVGLYGLGRFDLGLAGDLGLVRLATALLGRPAEVEDTAALLAPYAGWKGLASMHLLRHPLARDPRLA